MRGISVALLALLAVNARTAPPPDWHEDFPCHGLRPDDESHEADRLRDIRHVGAASIRTEIERRIDDLEEEKRRVKDYKKSSKKELKRLKKRLKKLKDDDDEDDGDDDDVDESKETILCPQVSGEAGRPDDQEVLISAIRSVMLEIELEREQARCNCPGSEEDRNSSKGLAKHETKIYVLRDIPDINVEIKLVNLGDGKQTEVTNAGISTASESIRRETSSPSVESSATDAFAVDEILNDGTVTSNVHDDESTTTTTASSDQSSRLTTETGIQGHA